jgi:hypothetical protein
MDIRQYFRKLRAAESTITEEFPMVISLETADGGKAGVASEVSRLTAAKMIIEGRAVLADEKEAAEFRARQIAEKEACENADMARRVQIAIVDQTALAHMKSKKHPAPSASEK